MDKSEKNSIRSGINIRRYCAAHEALVKTRLAQDDADKDLLHLHALKITWLQHERLVHLIVLSIVAVLFLFSIGLFIALMQLLALILVAVALGLLLAYIRHYFFLENTVQSWYVLYDRIFERISSQP